MSAPVLFVIDAPETFDPDADSTFVMVHEAMLRGFNAWGTLVGDLSLHHGQLRARARELAFTDDPRRLRFRGELEDRPTSDFRVVLMRKDPPVDEAFVTATWLLDYAGTLVVNHPRGLRELNEKLSIARFPECIPETFVSRDAGELREILKRLGGRMIVKPVYGFGGREILIAREDDPNLGSLLEIATQEGRRWTVAQAYLESARDGDKRILLVDGEPIGAVLRVPARGELRNNFHAGGRPERTTLTERDRAICSALGPMLRELGQFFVGIDVIGGQLTEINVTSPTGMQEINRLEGHAGNSTMQAVFWNQLESKLGEVQGS